jgi:hypothetical protein
MKENDIPESFKNAMNDLVVGRVVPLNTALNEPYEEPVDKICKKFEDIYNENKKLKKEVKMLEKLIELNMNDLWDIADQRDWYYEEYQKLKNRLTD